MKKELKELFKLSGKKFDVRLSQLCEKNKANPDFKKELATYMKGRLEVTGDRLEKIEKEINLKKQLSEVSDIISMNYIAKTYFGKTRGWLHQRINGNIVNGKKSKFTNDELAKFQAALKDVSKKIGSLSIG